MSNIYDPQFRKDLKTIPKKCRKYKRRLNNFELISEDIPDEEVDNYFHLIDALMELNTSYEEFKDQTLDESNSLQGAIGGNVFGPVDDNLAPWTQKSKIQAFNHVMVEEIDWWFEWLSDWSKIKLKIVDAEIADDEKAVNKWQRKMEDHHESGRESFPFYTWYINDIGKDPDKVFKVAKKLNKEYINCRDNNICEIKV